MISLILKCYLSILLPVSAVSVFIFVVGLYFIFRKKSPTQIVKQTPLSTVEVIPELVSANDLSAIAGEDVISTQLDLARAYIETDKKQLAIEMLQYVIKHGTAAQQTDAQQLLNHL